MKYKVIVAGGRDYSDYEFAEMKLDTILKNIPKDQLIFISGSCDIPGKLTFIRDDGTEVYGADGLGERYAKENNIPVEHYPANWKKHGKLAGPNRNRNMAKIATHCIVFYNNKNKGSKSVVGFAKQYKLQLREIII